MKSENRHRFDFALSFAGPQRPLAEKLRTAMLKRGFTVFYDRDYEHEMLGRNGADYLRNIYSRESRFCIVLISEDYDKSTWTKLEKESIQGRELLGEDGALIPVRVSEHLPTWLPETRIYFDITTRSLSDLLEILARLVNKQHLNEVSDFQRSILKAIFSNPKYTLRSLTGITHLLSSEKEVDREAVRAGLNELAKEGLVNEVIGKSGIGVHWMITQRGKQIIENG